MKKFCKPKSDGNLSKSMFVGMDVHKNYLQVAVLDEREKVLNNSRVDNSLIKVNEFFDSLHASSDTKPRLLERFASSFSSINSSTSRNSVMTLVASTLPSSCG